MGCLQNTVPAVITFSRRFHTATPFILSVRHIVHNIMQFTFGPNDEDPPPERALHTHTGIHNMEVLKRKKRGEPRHDSGGGTFFFFFCYVKIFLDRFAPPCCEILGTVGLTPSTQQLTEVIIRQNNATPSKREAFGDTGKGKIYQISGGSLVPSRAKS